MSVPFDSKSNLRGRIILHELHDTPARLPFIKFSDQKLSNTSKTSFPEAVSCRSVHTKRTDSGTRHLHSPRSRRRRCRMPRERSYLVQSAADRGPIRSRQVDAIEIKRMSTTGQSAGRDGSEVVMLPVLLLRRDCEWIFKQGMCHSSDEMVGWKVK